MDLVEVNSIATLLEPRVDALIEARAARIRESAVAEFRRGLKRLAAPVAICTVALAWIGWTKYDGLRTELMKQAEEAAKSAATKAVSADAEGLKLRVDASTEAIKAVLESVTRGATDTMRTQGETSAALLKLQSDTRAQDTRLQELRTTLDEIGSAASAVDALRKEVTTVAGNAAFVNLVAKQLSIRAVRKDVLLVAKGSGDTRPGAFELGVDPVYEVKANYKFAREGEEILEAWWAPIDGQYNFQDFHRVTLEVAASDRTSVELGGMVKRGHGPASMKIRITALIVKKAP